MNRDVRDMEIKKSDAKPARSAFWEAVGFAWDFGIVVVIPIVALGFGGRLLDKKLGTGPWLFLAAVVVSIIISTTLIVVRLTSIMRKIGKK